MGACCGRIAVAAIAVGMLAVPGARAAGPVTLAGTTVISGSRAVTVDVRVPRDARVATPFGDSPDIGVSGGGALSAFVLDRIDGSGPAFTLVGGAAQLNGERARFLLPVPQWPVLGGGTYENVKTFDDTTVVPAGMYRLYFVSSARATISLRLHGLSGRLTLAPARLAVGSTQPADHEIVTSPAPENAFAASATRALRRRGFAMHVLVSRIESDAAWQVVMCHDNPGAAIVAPARDMPGCPSGDKHTIADHRFPETTPSVKRFVQAFAGLPAGEHGVSAVYANEGAVSGTAYTTLWLEY